MKTNVTNDLREIDRWIAETIFGWVEFREEEYPHRMLWREGVEGSRVWGVWDEQPHYTTNPADAFAVLERCAEKCGTIMLQTHPDGHPIRNHAKKYCLASVGIVADADTLPLAICRYAFELFKPTTEGV